MTDAPIPSVVSRLRLDVYTEDGQWIESRDAALAQPSEWPATMVIYSTDVARARRVRLRLRGYVDGALRDYRGERYVPPPPRDAPPGLEPVDVPATDEPRLLRGSAVSGEPSPESAIDRLLWARLEEGSTEEATIVLRLACAGTMADIASDRTCVDERGVLRPTDFGRTENLAVPEWSTRLDDDRRALPAPRTRHFAGSTPLFDEEVSAPGGPIVLGTRAQSSFTGSKGIGDFDPRREPERVFVVPPLLVDRFEVTVGRYRAALARGFVPPVAVETRDVCTYSLEPANQETKPLNCVSFETARAFCRFEGGDLPTEAQWEFFATMAGRTIKSEPWGTEPPRCEDVVFGRNALFRDVYDVKGCLKSKEPAGPLAVDAGLGDETPAGVHGLGGNMSEWVRDRYFPYRSACWAGAPVYDPVCEDPSSPLQGFRGNAWTSDLTSPSATRQAAADNVVPLDVGFRCVRSR